MAGWSDARRRSETSSRRPASPATRTVERCRRGPGGRRRVDAATARPSRASRPRSPTTPKERRNDGRTERRTSSAEREATLELDRGPVVDDRAQPGERAREPDPPFGAVGHRHAPGRATALAQPRRPRTADRDTQPGDLAVVDGDLGAAGLGKAERMAHRRAVSQRSPASRSLTVARRGQPSG